MSLYTNYLERKNTPSDINEHLPTLERYASQCDHITEFGVRGKVSTYGLLMVKPKKYVGYDINTTEVGSTIAEANAEGIECVFITGDTRKISIEDTDLLFINTEHSYDQLKKRIGVAGR